MRQSIERCRCFGMRILFALLFSTASASAQEAPTSSVEERLEGLEQAIQALQKENERLRDELGMEGRPGIVVVKPAGREPVLSLGGLLQVQGEAGDQGDARFTTGKDRLYLRRTRLNAGGRFLEDFDFRVELDLSSSLGEASGLRAQLTDGYARWNRFAAFGVRAGQFKTPFGYEQLAPDPRLFTIERSLANDRLTLSRQVGLQLEGDVFGKRMTYAAGMFNGNGVNTNLNDNEVFLVVARVSGVAWEGTLAGASARWTAGAGAFGSEDAAISGQPPEFGFGSRLAAPRDNIFAGERTGWGLDTQLRLGRLDLWLEYLHERFDQTNGTPSRRVEAQGGYVQLAGFVVEKRLQLVAKFDGFDPRREAANSSRNWLAGANYYIKSDDLKVQLNYIRTDEAASDTGEDRVLGRLQVIF